MSGHIRAWNKKLALAKMTKILREKYQIYHTTIQIEDSKPGSLDIGCCDNDEMAPVVSGGPSGGIGHCHHHH
jgi:hypothetical protein